jgi:hypothetical protein
VPFRNVKALRSAIAKHLEHGPATIDVREDRVDSLSATYLSLSESEDWTFLEIEADFAVYQQRDYDQSGATVAVTNASTTITFSTSLGAAFTQQAGAWIFTGPDGDTYTIVRFTSETVANITPPYAGSTAAASESWTLSSEFYYLPDNCARPLGFIDRENGMGRLVILDRRREEQYLSWQTGAGTVYWLVDGDTLVDRPPDPGWTAVGATAAGTLTGTATYEVCYTFDQQGRESAPSVPVRVTLSSANNQINVAGMESTGANSGIYKNVYIRQLTSGPSLPSQEVYGRWLRSSQVNETTTTLNITAMPASSAREIVFTNGRRTIRPKFVPGADATIRIRYLMRPSRFVADSDYPYKWPEAFHDLIALGAAIEIGLSQGASQGKIDRWQKEYDRLYKRMKSTCLIVADSPAVKQQRGGGGGFGGGSPPYLTDGLPVGDFYGG